MKYLRSSQIIPNQGMSYTYYEIDENDEIKRMLTHIPDINKCQLYTKPPVKKLFAPERCEESSKEVFDQLWATQK